LMDGGSGGSGSSGSGGGSTTAGAQSRSVYTYEVDFRITYGGGWGQAGGSQVRTIPLSLVQLASGGLVQRIEVYGPDIPIPEIAEVYLNGVLVARIQSSLAGKSLQGVVTDQSAIRTILSSVNLKCDFVKKTPPNPLGWSLGWIGPAPGYSESVDIHVIIYYIATGEEHERVVDEANRMAQPTVQPTTTPQGGGGGGSSGGGGGGGDWWSTLMQLFNMLPQLLVVILIFYIVVTVVGAFRR